jgi:predicted kinase
MPLLNPRIYIFMGLIASGKSTLAEAFAGKYGLNYYNSDVERKRLAGIDRAERGGGDFEGGIYTPEMTRLTYDTLISKARKQVDQNRSVVLDGSYGKQVERQLIRDALAGSSAQAPVFILCEVSEQLTKGRLRKRSLDKTAVSDGTFEIYCIQKQNFEYPSELEASEFITIETDGDLEQLLTTLASSLNIPPFQPSHNTAA